MRNISTLGLAVAGLALACPQVVRADDATDPKMQERGIVQASIMRTYKDNILEVKIERLLDGAANKTAVRAGQVIFVDVSSPTRVLDEQGNTLDRDDEDAWLKSDKGWSALDAGKRVKIDFSGMREIAVPKEFPDEVRARGKLLVYMVTTIQVLSPSTGLEAPAAIAPIVVEGHIVRMFKDEKLIEVKVDSATPDAGAAKGKSPAAGTLILVRVERATVTDEKGVERKRDDKDAWFTKDDGWSILEEGSRVKVSCASTLQVPAPGAFPEQVRMSGPLLVHDATALQLLQGN